MTEQTQVSEQQRDIRLVVIDLDGTLLDSKHNVTPRVEAAVKATIARGIKVVLATGKTRRAAEALITQFGLDTPGIFGQGLTTYEANGDIRHQQLLDPGLARKVITFAEDRGFFVIAYSGHRLLVRKQNREVEDGLLAHHEPGFEIVGPLQNILANTPINKIVVCGDPREIKGLRWQLNLQVGTAGRVVQAGVPTMVEVLPPGASKGAALKQLARDLNIKPEHIMAIGDAENDIEMIQFAGLGVAMGQSDAKTKAAADVVVGTLDEDGVAEALEKFVLPPAAVEEAIETGVADAPPAEPVEVITAESTVDTPEASKDSAADAPKSQADETPKADDDASAKPPWD